MNNTNTVSIVTTMSDKSLKECGTELCHGRNSDGGNAHTNAFSSSHGSKKGQKSKAYNRDKKLHDKFQQSLASNGRGYTPSDQRSHTHKDGVRGRNEKPSLSTYEESLYESIAHSGKKKPSSLNHLLNFTIASTDRRGSAGHLSTGRRRARQGHSFNKEQFLQANCQFVVSTNGDYTVYSGDPDLLVDWEHIEQVRLFCHQIPSCPICLYPPRAAKITRCGHVYCWSCILHYLSLGDKKWRKCPICYESIYSKDLKSVTALASHQYIAGDTLTMKLMARRKGTTNALPKEEWSKRKDNLLTLEDTSVHQFAKLLSASPAQVLVLITPPEREQLEHQLGSIDKDSGSELCFVESALYQLDSRELALKKACGIAHDGVIHNLDTGTSTIDKPPTTKKADNYFESHFEDPFSGDSGCPNTQSTVNEQEPSVESTSVEPSSSPIHIDDDCQTSSDSGQSSPIDTHTESSPPQSHTMDSDMVYFYQASDGQHLYIHPVNAKCLMKEYGCLQYSPLQIKATIVDTEGLSMTEDIRGRYRYLNHLPLTCELALVELDLRLPLLSRATLAMFSDDLATRRQRRAKKKRDEKRKERKAEPQQLEPGFIVPTSAYGLTPEIFHDFLSLASTPRGSNQADATTVVHNDPSSAPSFAQALQAKPTPVWPVTTPTTPVTPHYNMTRVVSSDHQFDDGAVPTFRDAFNEALVTASASVMANQNVSDGKPGNKTAKKGRKKMVLFSTGSTRGTS